MSTPRSRLDDALRSLGELPAPPPSAALLGAVRAPLPVRRRSPWKAFAWIVLASSVVVALHVHSHGVRRDFASLPTAPFWTMAAAWAAAFLLPLAIALVPKRGSMFADVSRARAMAFAIPALALVFAILLRVEGATTLHPTATAKIVQELEWCLVTGLEMTVVPLALGVLVLRRAAMPLGTRWIGAALGAANGALAALMLHVHCNVGGALHCGVSHAGHAAIGAILGALLVPLLVREHVEG